MPELVALALPAGPDFVDALRRVWGAGDAAFPLDARLPPAAAAAQMSAMAPGAVIEAGGERRRVDGGRPVEPGDAVVVATSGTTGEPRGVVHTHSSLAANAEATSAALAVDPASDHWLCCLPVAHVGGLSVIVRALHTATPLTVHARFDAAAVDAAPGVTLTSLVTRALRQVDTSRFRRILLGGGPMPVPRPANTVATYGLTETGSGVVYEGWPLDGVELAIDEGGGIRLRGAVLARAWRDGSPLTGDDGWYDTGDGGEWAADGRLRVLGRRGDVIVTGGEKVWPEVVEPVIASVAGVAEVAVVGRPDPDWGQRVVAVVVPDGEPPALAAVRDVVRARLPVWCAPTDLVVTDSLPRTALGKVRRGAVDPGP